MDDRAYGALIERGIVTAVLGDQYAVASLDRSGIQSSAIGSIGSAGGNAHVDGDTVYLTSQNGSGYAVGAAVYFFMFRDGTGTILGQFANRDIDPGPSALGTVSENTTAGWTAMPMYVPKDGEFCIYSDTHELKIGDGLAYIVDLPFVGHGEATAVSIALAAHAGNMNAHVSQEDRDRWDNKVDVGVAGEQLVFTRS